jgi:hypothetical protein
MHHQGHHQSVTCGGMFNFMANFLSVLAMKLLNISKRPGLLKVRVKPNRTVSILVSLSIIAQGASGDVIVIKAEK